MQKITRLLFEFLELLLLVLLKCKMLVLQEKPHSRQNVLSRAVKTGLLNIDTIFRKKSILENFGIFIAPHEIALG